MRTWHTILSWEVSPQLQVGAIIRVKAFDPELVEEDEDWATMEVYAKRHHEGRVIRVSPDGEDVDVDFGENGEVYPWLLNGKTFNQFYEVIG